MTTRQDHSRRLARGWNTWNVRSVLSHVLLPEGFSISLGIKLYSTGRCLREVLLGLISVMETNRSAPLGALGEVGSD